MKKKIKGEKMYLYSENRDKVKGKECGHTLSGKKILPH